MKKTGMTALGLLLMTGATAQVAGYSFEHDADQYLPLNPASGAIIQNHTVQDDFVGNDRVKLPFPFNFGGQVMDSVNINANGYLWFGRSKALEMTSKWPISTMHASNTKGIISALGVDLVPYGSTGPTTTIKSAVYGTSPFRVFTVEWANTSRASGTSTPEGDTLEFQIRLYEGSNMIEAQYGRFGLKAGAAAASAEIGLKGATYSDFNNRIMTDGAWAMSIPGPVQTSRSPLSNVSSPGWGFIMRWKPGASTGVGEIEEAAAIRLYPQPATDHIRLEGEVLKPGMRYQVYDISGRRAISGVLDNERQIDIRLLSPGSYLLELVTDRGAVRKRFMRGQH